jgi:predicted PhzF superfamily epimerase YddE/YHI9
MSIPYFQVDAFTARAFGGNPAGVCPLEQWLPDALLQNIAQENNLSETAFFIRQEGGYGLRWFTPTMEVDLCGHATLAAAFVIFSELGCEEETVRFHSKSGWLSAARRGELIELDFPSRPAAVCATPQNLGRGLGAEPGAVFKSRDYLAVFDTPEEVAALRPDMAVLEQLDGVGVIVTAAAKTADFVSRFFAPKAGVPEDPVTGSAHCTLIPYWAERLGKTELFAQQISRRGGELWCRDLGDRVGIGGRAVIYSRGQLEIGGALNLAPNFNPLSVGP